MFVATGADGAHGYAGASAALMQGGGERAVTAEILETLALDERRAAIAVVIGAQVRRRSCGLYPELADHGGQARSRKLTPGIPARDPGITASDCG